jgi:glycosyltransferase involved in cell wall biosynthesis
MVQRLRIRLNIWRASAREWALFDAGVIKRLLGGILTLSAFALIRTGRLLKGLSILTGVHRADLSAHSSAQIEQFVRADIRLSTTSVIRQAVVHYIDSLPSSPSNERWHADPGGLLRGNSIVLKSWSPGERGVLLLYYSYVYPLFWKLFDMTKITSHYRLVIEPSWSGFCDLNVLLFLNSPDSVFVGATEPRDRDFIDGLHSNLISAPFSSNTWTDERVFRPLQNIQKDIDVVMVAGWGVYKRHWAVFRALSRLKARGHSLRIALVGYQLDMSVDQIWAQARFFGIDNWIEVHEGITPEAVNALYNRAKVNLMWSRREGVNRAIVEGMFADTPCVIRKGFNYGYDYPLINEQTGAFATEANLGDTLLQIIKCRGTFSPRAWVAERMRAERTTAVLNSVMSAHAERLGEKWSRNLVTKVNTLNGVTYRDETEESQFSSDLAFLNDCIRRN